MRILSSMVVIGLACTVVPSTASALTLGVDLGLAKPIGSAGDVLGLGFGVGGRVGFSLPIPVISIVPEAMVDYTSFGFSNALPGADVGRLGALRIMGGGRVGVSTGILTPSVYVHLGYGSSSFSANGPGGMGSVTQKGLALNAGGALDFTLLPVIGLGAHVGYNQIGGDATTTVNGRDSSAAADALKWIDFGVHASLSF